MTTEVTYANGLTAIVNVGAHKLNGGEGEGKEGNSYQALAQRLMPPQSPPTNHIFFRLSLGRSSFETRIFLPSVLKREARRERLLAVGHPQLAVFWSTITQVTQRPSHILPSHPAPSLCLASSALASSALASRCTIPPLPRIRGSIMTHLVWSDNLPFCVLLLLDSCPSRSLAQGRAGRCLEG